MTSSAAQKDNKQWQQRVREWNRADDLLVCCQVHKLSPPLVVVMILLLHLKQAFLGYLVHLIVT